MAKPLQKLDVFLIRQYYIIFGDVAGMVKRNPTVLIKQ